MQAFVISNYELLDTYMKTKVLLGSVLMSAVGAGFLLAEWGATNNTYSPRSEEVRVRPDIEERKMGGDIIFKELRAMPDGTIDLNEINSVKEEVKRQMSKRNALGLQWEFMGPANRGGRTRAVLVDKDNSNRVYTGGVSGGIWISDNAGGTWTEYDDLMENLMISTIVQGADGAIYVGTGCTFEGSAPMPGAGIFKSTDGGQSFVKLASTDPAANGNNWRYINRIATNPNNASEVHAGTAQGLFASTDGGNTWTQSLYIDPSCNIVGTGEIEDLEYTESGRLLVGYSGGVFYSDTPTDPCSFVRPTGIPTASQRIDIDYCEDDNNIAYAIQVSGGLLAGVYQSDDGGVTWSPISPAPPSTTIDSTFSLFGDNGQGNYDLALEIKPDECGKIYIGGVQTYRVAGSWARIAENFAFEHSGLYLHSDKHYFEFDPNNPDVMYVGSDGGIGKTTNAGATQPFWTTQNRNYGTTQFYGIALARDGRVIGGTQDNGTWLLDPSLPGISGKDGTTVSGGDGFDCEVSNIGPIAFSTIQYGVINRVNAVTGNFANLTGAGTSGEGVAPFWSVIRLWETTNDPTSKDSVVFNNDTTELSLAKGNGATRNYTGTMLPVQDAAVINNGSVFFSNAFASLVQVVDDFDGDGVLTYVNDSGNVVDAGTFDYLTGEYNVTFPVAPADQSDIKGFFSTSFNAGDTLVLRSNTLDYGFDYILQADLNVGDSIVVQDPVQSLMAHAVGGGPLVTRDALNEGKLPDWIDLRTVANSGTPRCFEFSEDGNHLYVGSASGVWRYSGLNDLYGFNADSVASVVTGTRIYQNPSGAVTGIVLHPSDDEKMVVTMGGYGHSTHVVELSGIRTGTAIPRVVEGNLPGFPVYDAEYDVRNPSTVLIGTDFGVWSTIDINAGTVEWANENATLANTPVFDVMQQRLPWQDATNHEVFYLGTHGRGIWSTGDLVNSTPDFEDFAGSTTDLGLSMYPNPVTNQGRVDFTLPGQGTVDIQIFDLSGKAVKQYMGRSFPAGDNTFSFEASDIPGGTYIMTVNTGGTYSTGKFVIVK